MNTLIKKDEVELTLHKEVKTYKIIVFVNDKEVELIITISYNESSMCNETDWEYLNSVDLTDEEADDLDEYVYSREWLKSSKKDYLSTNSENDEELNRDTTFKIVIDKERNGNFNLVDIKTNEVVCEFQNNEGGLDD